MEHSTYHVYPREEADAFDFTTVAGVTYACYFVSAEAVFDDYPDIANNIYSFNLVLEGSYRKEQSSDEKIGFTIISIIRTFLIERQSAVVYLCDTLDGRQNLRKRKFDIWFRRSDAVDIIKLDREIKNADPIILNSLILSKAHPLFNRIIHAFEDFNNRMNNK